MIAIQSENGELIKVLKNVLDGEFGFHRSFGIISKERAVKRVDARKRQYYDYTNDEWLCSFNIDKTGQSLKISALSDCEVTALDSGWKLKTSMGVFNISEILNASISPLLVDHPDKNKWLNHLMTTIFLATFLLIPIIYFMGSRKVEGPVEEKILEPINVKILKEIKTVKIEQVFNPTTAPTQKMKMTNSKVAVHRNLGFLGMVGSKELNKVVGGAPQQLKAATAGAGAGGNAGSPRGSSR